MSSRYTYRKKFANSLEMYSDQLAARKVNLINHYSSPNMTYPNVAEKAAIKPVEHVWKLGDRFYKLAHEHYGEKKLWWLIAWYNRAPTENHIKLGQVISIPKPLAAALSFMRDR